MGRDQRGRVPLAGHVRCFSRGLEEVVGSQRKNARTALHRRGAGGKGTPVGMQVTQEGSRGPYFIRAGKEGVRAQRKKRKKQGCREFTEYGTNQEAFGEPKGVLRAPDGSVPHWSECGFDAWPGQKHWRRPCCNPRVHTRRAFHPCVSVDAS